MYHLLRIVRKGSRFLKRYINRAQPCVSTIISCTEEEEFEQLFVRGLTQTGKELLLSSVNGYAPVTMKQPRMNERASTSVMLIVFKNEGQWDSGYVCLSVEPAWLVAEKLRQYNATCNERYLRGPFGFGENKMSKNVICIPLWKREEDWNKVYCKRMKMKEPLSFNDEQKVKNSFAQVVKCLFQIFCWTNQNDGDLNKTVREFFPRSVPPFIGLNYSFSINQTYNKCKRM